MTDRVKTFKGQLEQQGISLVDWAHLHGFNVRTVHAVLSGQLKAKRGVSHRIAVAAGLKIAPKKAS